MSRASYAPVRSASETTRVRSNMPAIKPSHHVASEQGREKQTTFGHALFSSGRHLRGHVLVVGTQRMPPRAACFNPRGENCGLASCGSLRRQLSYGIYSGQILANNDGG